MGKKKNLDALAASVNEALQSSNKPVSRAREETAALLASAMPLKSKVLKETAAISDPILDRRSEAQSPVDSDGPPALPVIAPRSGGPSVSASPLESTSPSESTSPPIAVGPSLSDTLPVNSLWRTVKAGGGFSRVPNDICDELDPHLDPAEQSIYRHLFRLSWGYGKDTCHIGMPRLAERVNLGQTAARGAVKKLISRGLIEITERAFGKGIEQGTTFRIPLPDWVVKLIGPSKSDRPSKSEGPPRYDGPPFSKGNKDIKEQNKKDLDVIIDYFRRLHSGDPAYTVEQLERDVYQECANRHIRFDGEHFNKRAGR